MPVNWYFRCRSCCCSACTTLMSRLCSLDRRLSTHIRLFWSISSFDIVLCCFIAFILALLSAYRKMNLLLMCVFILLAKISDDSYSQFSMRSRCPLERFWPTLENFCFTFSKIIKHF